MLVVHADHAAPVADAVGVRVPHPPAGVAVRLVALPAEVHGGLNRGGTGLGGSNGNPVQETSQKVDLNPEIKTHQKSKKSRGENEKKNCQKLANIPKIEKHIKHKNPEFAFPPACVVGKGCESTC